MRALGQTGGTVPYVPSYKGPHTEHNSRTFPLLLHYYVKSEREREYCVLEYLGLLCAARMREKDKCTRILSATAYCQDEREYSH
jgi:hypothetical protein